jgi:hypothetical protein
MLRCESIEDNVTRCDSCQRMKASHEFKAPLGNAEEPTEPFQVTSMDMIGSCCLAPTKNNYSLTSVDHAEAFLFPDRMQKKRMHVYRQLR